MANNTISQVEINGTTYDLLDANTLSALDSLKTRVTTLEDSVADKFWFGVNTAKAMFWTDGEDTITYGVTLRDGTERILYISPDGFDYRRRVNGVDTILWNK